uniref:Uncharacterized protein n=1 Tax=Tanacetum cinerariifolium TaxID=118510 RepID=A0A6L2KG71_TANCI|nr:hypothetical protein [Tanacetum cinerariifolium]
MRPSKNTELCDLEGRQEALANYFEKISNLITQDVRKEDDKDCFTEANANGNNKVVKTEKRATYFAPLLKIVTKGSAIIGILFLLHFSWWQRSSTKRYIDTKPNHELIHYCLQNLPYEYKWNDKVIPVVEGSTETTTERYMENYKNVSQDIRDQLNAEVEAVQIILTRIDNDIYSTVDACPNACEMWKAIERLKQGKSINVQDLETNLYWEFRKFTSRDGESLESYYSGFYKMMNELVRNQCDVTKHQVNVRSQQAATRNRGKAIVNFPPPIYDQEPIMVAEDDEMSKDKEIDKLIALISLSFKKIYKPTNNNLRTSSNTSRANQDNSPRINRGTGYENQRIVNVDGARENVEPKWAKDATYHKEKMLLCKHEEAGFQLNAEQVNWRDDTDDEPDDQKLKAHYMYMAQIQEVNPDAADNSGPIFDSEPLQKVPNNDNYNVFAIESEYPEQSKSVNDTYLIEQDEHNAIIDSLDMSYDREQADRDDDDDLANEHDLLASLIEKLKCEIDDSKNRNKFLETSNKALVDKVNGEIEDYKNKNKILESSNNHFKEAKNELSKTNQLMYKDLKKFQPEIDKYHDVKYASKVEIDCAKAKGDLMSYKLESEKLSNEYTRKINDLDQTISEMKNEQFAHQETISIMSQQKEAQIKFHKTREDKELDKVIALENKVNVLDNIVYKTGQSVQTMNMLNRNCKTSFAKTEFLKKAQRANPHLYDIGCYNDNITLMLAPESDEEAATWRRLAANDLCTRYCAGGGWANWNMTRQHGTVAAVQGQYEVQKSVRGSESPEIHYKDNPSISQPPPEPPDVESFFDLKPDMIAGEILDKLNEDKCFDPGREINVSTKIEDDDHFPFMIVIRFFISYFIFPEVSPLLLSAESEDTIFDPGIFD